MKKRYILFTIIFMFFAIFFVNSESKAADLDEIVNYVVTVDPRMNDGSLDINYEITWRVLDSTTEGPLEWVKIGTPNENFDTPTALTSNIRYIRKYNGSYVRIDFTKPYRAGEEVTFKFSIHQPYMHKTSFGKTKYKFTPAWFTDIKVDNLTIRWNEDSVKKSDTKLKDENYLVWHKANMKKGEKLTINVQYDKSAFSALGVGQKTKSIDIGPILVMLFWGAILVMAILSSFRRWRPEDIMDIEDSIVDMEEDTEEVAHVHALVAVQVVVPAVAQVAAHARVLEAEEQVAQEKTSMELI